MEDSQETTETRTIQKFLELGNLNAVEAANEIVKGCKKFRYKDSLRRDHIYGKRN